MDHDLHGPVGDTSTAAPTPLRSPRTVVVLGATGYVGGRLVPRLLAEGHHVRVLVRDASRLEGREWKERVEVFAGDALRRESLDDALHGADALYYLIHSMRAGESFRELDLEAAGNAARACAVARVRRIVYLGGLGDERDDLSEHLASRHLTGAALASAGVPVTEFRAGVIVGSGSLSFEIIRNLTERLPAMTCPRWVYTRAQPIAIRNVLDYLCAAMDVEKSAGRVIEIGGADVVSYGDMIRGYARARGLRRLLVPVPVLTPRLSSFWVHWTTPVPASISRPLIEGLRNETVVRSDLALRLFPGIRPMGFDAAVRRALGTLERGGAPSTWADSLTSSRANGAAVILDQSEGMIRERRVREVDAPAREVFAAFTALGGARGWPGWNWAWRLRGAVDRLLGGVGFRRGRRDPVRLRTGDALDFWRVEAVVPDRLLRLRAEMKVPGRAWLEFTAQPLPGDRALLVQTAYFAPRGLSGLAYWYLLYPIHRPIFSGLCSAVARAAVSEETHHARSVPPTVPSAV